MRDRGITNPGLTASIGTALAVGGASALTWSFAGAAPAPGSIEGVARSLGTVALIVGTLMALNYFYALLLVRKLRRGEGVIASWIVPSLEFDRFRRVERARTKRKNNWRMPGADWPSGLPVAFSANAVLVGDSYFLLRSRGLSRFYNVRIETDTVSSVEFAMCLTVLSAGSHGGTARYRGHLRIPISTRASVEAARVVGHYRQIIAN